MTDIVLVGEKIANDFAIAQLPFVMFDGNSKVAGIGSSSGDNRYPGFSYPSQLVQALGGPIAFSFRNQGASGASTETLETNYAVSNTYNSNGLSIRQGFSLRNNREN